MLSVGDLLWVPFTYSYTAYYLAQNPKDIGLLGCAGVLAVQAVGYYIFRGANNEKNEFRQGKNPKSQFSTPSSPIAQRADRSLSLQTSSHSRLNVVLVFSLRDGGVDLDTPTSTFQT